MLWDLAEGKRLYSLDAGEIINALCFSPNRYWLCAATSQCIKARAPGALAMRGALRTSDGSWGSFVFFFFFLAHGPKQV